MIVHRSAPPAAIGAPTVVPTARPRSTLAPLTRRLALPSFVQPVLILAVGTAALSAAAGYLPVLGARHHLDPLATGARVSLMAATAALIQPWAGQAHDRDSLASSTGSVALLIAAAGIAIWTPIAFANLAGSGPTITSGKPWEPVKSAANSVTPEVPFSLAPSAPSASPPGCSPSPRASASAPW